MFEWKKNNTCVWLISLTMITFSSTHFPENVMIHSPLWLIVHRECVPRLLGTG